MAIICTIRGHRSQARVLRNGSVEFSRCCRCGTDLIRQDGGAWKAPKGFKVVWPTPGSQDDDQSASAPFSEQERAVESAAAPEDTHAPVVGLAAAEEPSPDTLDETADAIDPAKEAAAPEEPVPPGSPLPEGIAAEEQTQSPAAKADPDDFMDDDDEDPFFWEAPPSSSEPIDPPAFQPSVEATEKKADRRRGS